MNLDKALDERNRTPDLAIPSLPALAYLLRHQELWPASFGPWYWWENNTCAIGLAAQVWHGEASDAWAKEALNLDYTCIAHLFLAPHDSLGHTQPHDVATRNDHFLATTAF